MQIRTDNAIIYLDCEDNRHTIQIVEGRLGPNAVIILNDEQIKQIYDHINEWKLNK